MAKIEMSFGTADKPFSFKIDGQEVGDILTAVNINIESEKEPTILLRFHPESLDLSGNVATVEEDSGAFL